jgi:intraflagellar transport protein 80
VKCLPSEESQQAELALFQRQPEDAESILLQAGLTYRAIKLNLRLFNWDRYVLEVNFYILLLDKLQQPSCIGFLCNEMPTCVNRALDLAIMYKTHLDTVLWKREQYLQKTKHDETKERFLHYHLQVF